MSSVGQGTHGRSEGDFNLNNAKDFYTAWLKFSDNVGSEKKAYEKLTPQDRKILAEVLNIIKNNKKNLDRTDVSPALKPKDYKVLDPYFKDKTFAQLVDKLQAGAEIAPHARSMKFTQVHLAKRIDSSYREIYPLAKAETVLAEKYQMGMLLQVTKELDRLKTDLETSPEDLPPTKVFEKLEKWADTLSGQSKNIAKAVIKEMRTEDTKTAAAVTASGNALPKLSKDQVLNIVEGFKTKLIEAGKNELQKTWSWTDMKSMMSAAKRSMADAKAMAKTGLGNANYFLTGLTKGDILRNPDRINKLDRMRGEELRLHAVKTELDKLLGKALNEGLKDERSIEDMEGSGKARSMVELRREINVYRQSVEKLAAEFESMKRELEPHLRNPEYAALYATILKENAVLLTDHIESAHELEAALFKTSPDDFKRFISPYLNKGETPINAVRLALRDFPPEIRKNWLPQVMETALLAEEFEKRAFIWGQYAADLGEPAGALMVAKLLAGYAVSGGMPTLADAEGKDTGVFSKDRIDLINKQKAVYKAAGDYVEKTIANSQRFGAKERSEFLGEGMRMRSYLHVQRFKDLLLNGENSSEAQKIRDPKTGDLRAETTDEVKTRLDYAKTVEDRAVKSAKALVKFGSVEGWKEYRSIGASYLYDLFVLTGSKEAGKFLVDFYKETYKGGKIPDKGVEMRSNDLRTLEVLSLAGIEGAKDLLALIAKNNKGDNDLIEANQLVTTGKFPSGKEKTFTHHASARSLELGANALIYGILRNIQSRPDMPQAELNREGVRLREYMRRLENIPNEQLTREETATLDRIRNQLGNMIRNPILGLAGSPELQEGLAMVQRAGDAIEAFMPELERQSAQSARLFGPERAAPKALSEGDLFVSFTEGDTKAGMKLASDLKAKYPGFKGPQDQIYRDLEMITALAIAGSSDANELLKGLAENNKKIPDLQYALEFSRTGKAPPKDAKSFTLETAVRTHEKVKDYFQEAVSKYLTEDKTAIAGSEKRGNIARNLIKFERTAKTLRDSLPAKTFFPRADAVLREMEALINEPSSDLAQFRTKQKAVGLSGISFPGIRSTPNGTAEDNALFNSYLRGSVEAGDKFVDNLEKRLPKGKNVQVEPSDLEFLTTFAFAGSSKAKQLLDNLAQRSPGNSEIQHAAMFVKTGNPPEVKTTSGPGVRLAEIEARLAPLTDLNDPGSQEQLYKDLAYLGEQAAKHDRRAEALLKNLSNRAPFHEGIQASYTEALRVRRQTPAVEQAESAPSQKPVRGTKEPETGFSQIVAARVVANAARAMSNAVPAYLVEHRDISDAKRTRVANAFENLIARAQTFAEQSGQEVVGNIVGVSVQAIRVSLNSLNSPLLKPKIPETRAPASTSEPSSASDELKGALGNVKEAEGPGASLLDSLSEGGVRAEIALGSLRTISALDAANEASRGAASTATAEAPATATASARRWGLPALSRIFNFMSSATPPNPVANLFDEAKRTEIRDMQLFNQVPNFADVRGLKARLGPEKLTYLVREVLDPLNHLIEAQTEAKRKQGLNPARIEERVLSEATNLLWGPLFNSMFDKPEAASRNFHDITRSLLNARAVLLGSIQAGELEPAEGGSVRSRANSDASVAYVPFEDPTVGRPLSRAASEGQLAQEEEDEGPPLRRNLPSTSQPGPAAQNLADLEQDNPPFPGRARDAEYVPGAVDLQGLNFVGDMLFDGNRLVELGEPLPGLTPEQEREVDEELRKFNERFPENPV